MNEQVSEWIVVEAIPELRKRGWVAVYEGDQFRFEINIEDDLMRASNICVALNRNRDAEITRLSRELEEAKADMAAMTEKVGTYRKYYESTATERDDLKTKLAEAKQGEADADSMLCELWDALGARGRVSEQVSAMDRIRDLIVIEAERDDLKTRLLKAEKAVEWVKQNGEFIAAELSENNCPLSAKKLTQLLKEMETK